MKHASAFLATVNKIHGSELQATTKLGHGLQQSIFGHIVLISDELAKSLKPGDEVAIAVVKVVK